MWRAEILDDMRVEALTPLGELLDSFEADVHTAAVEAFRASLVTTIEAAIDAYVTTAGLPTFIPTNTADAERTGRLVGLSAAARIVADHDSSAGHAASARPAEG